MPSVLQAAASWLRAPGVELSFLARSALRWRRGAPQLGNEPKDGLFAELPADVASAAASWEAKALADYALAPLRARSRRTHWLGNLALLAGLRRLADAAGGAAAPCGPDGVVRALDVGCGDFHYAFALQRWLARGDDGSQRHVALRGVELDGYGVYRDGRSRADHGDAHAALAAQDGAVVRFEVADFARRAWPEQDVVTMFFPFLTAHACLRWGAPVSRLRPRRLLQRAVATVRPGGWLVVVNQTAAERAALGELLADAPVERIAEAPWTCAFVPWAERTGAQVGTLWRRLGA
jgi:SAM-dependent methyltransferase